MSGLYAPARADRPEGNPLCPRSGRCHVKVSLRDNLDLGTPSGRLMFQIIGAMAEFERELIRERVKAGMKNARAKGIHVGRPCLKVDVAAINRLRSQGVSWRDIAAKLKVGLGTVYRIAQAKQSQAHRL